MVHPAVVGIATGVGLLTDKYMLGVTNFVDKLSDMQSSNSETEFVKAAMYGGAVLGMMVMGPLSDYVGRRVCLIACSAITLLGALGSVLSFSARFLIACRIITGIGMGGEYPLAATHSADSGDSNSGGRNVALLYLFGNGLGQASCPFVVWLLMVVGLPNEAVWRMTFGVGAILAAVGLVLRILVTKDSDKFQEAKEKREKSAIPPWAGIAAMPLAGTALSWFLFDIVEYGLKQNDAAIFAHSKTDLTPHDVFSIFLTRLLVIPSLIVAAALPKYMAIKGMQLLGFLGTAAVNFVLMLQYTKLHNYGPELLFDFLYILQLSFQSLPGVTTMAIPAEIFPSAYKGTAHGISAAMGKVGATVGSYFFALLKDEGKFSEIFGVVFGTSLFAALITTVLTPYYNGATLELMEALASEGKESMAVKVLYSGPRTADKAAFLEEDSADDEDNEGATSSDEA